MEDILEDLYELGHQARMSRNHCVGDSTARDIHDYYHKKINEIQRKLEKRLNEKLD